MIYDKFTYFDTIRTLSNFVSVWSYHEIESIIHHTPYTATHVSYQGVVVPIQGRTWLDLWSACDSAIIQSGDRAHAFIEGFKSVGTTLELITGS